ncbi:hypothetical protein [Winogradskyella jejuensis]|uniref:Uncharacterized protein n=1 Tax=Winogradskyella jejuensis TaxID=1089305 RepID=A0A1M5SZL7_9FLAO|nr:hypothetical protein [Winogradskyella jejuensis]SHH43922.1 hypothetical protein SAMN05444148_2019 [Winogradskyella jejuensis]
MVLNNIENLLERYDNAETTLQEEAQLRAYFSSDNVAPHLEHYKPLFVYFTNTQQEAFTKDVPLNTKKKTRLYQWISVAAVAVIMLGIMIPQAFGPSEQEKEEALLAYNKAMDALSLISIGMNEGKEQLNTLSLVSDNFENGRQGASRLNEFNKAKSRIFKNN